MRVHIVKGHHLGFPQKITAASIIFLPLAVVTSMILPAYADEIIFTTPNIYTAGNPTSPTVSGGSGMVKGYNPSTPGIPPVIIATTTGVNPMGLAEDPAGNIFFAGVSTTLTVLTADLYKVTPSGGLTNLGNLFPPINIAQVGLPSQNIPINLTYDPVTTSILYNTPQTLGTSGKPSTIGSYSLISNTISTTPVHTLLASDGSVGGIAVDPNTGDIFYTAIKTGPYAGTLNKLCAAPSSTCTAAGEVVSYGIAVNPSGGAVNAFSVASSLTYDPVANAILYNTPQTLGTSGQDGGIGALYLGPPPPAGTPGPFAVPSSSGSPEGVAVDSSGNIFTVATQTGPFRGSIVENGVVGPKIVDTSAGFIFSGVTNNVLVPPNPCIPSAFFPSSAGSVGCIFEGPSSNPLSISVDSGGNITAISADIGGYGTTYFYTFSWNGGTFDATASVSGGSLLGSYAFDLLNAEGKIIASSADLVAGTFTGNIDYTDLQTGTYAIGLVSDNANDPRFTINFVTPLGASPDAAVPEPSTLTLIVSGLVGLLWIHRRTPRRTGFRKAAHLA